MTGFSALTIWSPSMLSLIHIWIKDPVFSSEVLGKGCAIEPSCGEVVAPADGIVEKIAKTHHAISLQCDNGLKVLKMCIRDSGSTVQ